MEESSINTIQANILRRMFEQDGLRFSEVNAEKIPTDQFSYHLKQLIKAKLVEKLPDQTYRLTIRGRSKTIMLSPGANTFIEQGFLAVLLVVSRHVDGQELFLTQERNKVPNRGKIGFFGDKIRRGESIPAAAERALLLQTGLTGRPVLKSTWHLIDRFEGAVVEDKYFFIHSVTEFEGDLMTVGLTGENRWMTRDAIRSTGKTYHEVDNFIESIKSPHVTCHECVTDLDSY